MFPVPRRAGKIRGAEITDQKFREQRLHRADGAERRDGGAYRPFLHDRHLSAASSFQIGV
jgi:hypothetical protein